MKPARKVFDDWNADLAVATSTDPADDAITFRSTSLGRDVKVEGTLVHQPDGIRCAAVSAGIKYADVLDFTVVKLDAPGSAAGVFTRSLCPSYAVLYGREALADGHAQVLAVVSKNANVFTPQGEADTRQMAGWLADELGVKALDIVPSCTGVIGVPLPMEKIRAAIPGIGAKLEPGALDKTARAILTTDRGPKVCSVRVGDLVVSAMAKGAGMIEPNMATMLVYFFTNADLDGKALRAVLTDAVDRTFNSLTVDSDTSTSDTVVMFSTRKVALDGALRSDFTAAVRAMSIKLARDIVAQSEGATKLIECRVRLDSTPADAKIMAKKIANSPLVKTAVHGGDPNWGRIVMAIGKPDERLTIGAIPRDSVVIEMMGQVVFDRARPIAIDLAALSRELKSSTRVSIDVRIGEGRHAATVWGCDLSHRYVDINAEYMT
ncbi:MAG TPA: bifunctional glutamate N-acetyltransferase/amino-acid acetyltransferase ArgJ [Polyangiaceae bacterium]|nr:bifunctional glutamate N-acetyltransferase/amino-acid acetyltransferase ArgJ [Polyangiaceae bacterium]